MTDSKVCPTGHSVLISYSASRAQLIRLNELRDKPRNLGNNMTIRVDSTYKQPLVLNMPKDILNLLPQFNTCRMTVCPDT
jgi:hypothetical protein